MHDIDRYPGRIGDRDGAVGGLTLDLRRPRIGMALRSGKSLGEIFLLKRRNQVAILCVNEW
jgi:hypothetical protein